MLTAAQVQRNMIELGEFIFTVQSIRTQRHYTFRIRQGYYTRFVDVLSGDNNETDYTVIGTLNGNTFKYLTKSRFQESATSVAAFRFLMESLENSKKFRALNVFQTCKCVSCDKRLTNPISAHNHIGLVCANNWARAVRANAA